MGAKEKDFHGDLIKSNHSTTIPKLHRTWPIFLLLSVYWLFEQTLLFESSFDLAPTNDVLWPGMPIMVASSEILGLYTPLFEHGDLRLYIIITIPLHLITAPLKRSRQLIARISPKQNGTSED